MQRLSFAGIPQCLGCVVLVLWSKFDIGCMGSNWKQRGETNNVGVERLGGVRMFILAQHGVGITPMSRIKAIGININGDNTDVIAYADEIKFQLGTYATTARAANIITDIAEELTRRYGVGGSSSQQMTTPPPKLFRMPAE